MKKSTEKGQNSPIAPPPETYGPENSLKEEPEKPRNPRGTSGKLAGRDFIMALPSRAGALFREVFSGENLIIAALALSPLLLTVRCDSPKPPPMDIPAEDDSEDICRNQHDCVKKARIYGRNGNTELARKTAVKACDLGSAEGCYLQGIVMIREARQNQEAGNTGRSVKDTLRHGTDKVRNGCITGFPPACQMMAELTEKGTGTARDPRRAGEYHTRACEMDLTESCLKAAVFQWSSNNHQKAWELSRKSCESGNEQGCAVYAIAAENTGNPDPPEKVRQSYFRQGCDKYDIPGSCFLYGLRSLNAVVRLKYLEKACSTSSQKQFCDPFEKEKKRLGTASGNSSPQP